MAAGVLTLTSCKSEFEQHVMQFAPMKPNMVAYADQASDTIHVLSTDAWKLTVDNSWLAVTPNEMTPKYKGALYNTLLKLAFTVNTDRLTRQTIFHVQGGHTINMPVVQVGWLNISSPAGHLQRPQQRQTERQSILQGKPSMLKQSALPFLLHYLHQTAQWCKRMLRGFKYPRPLRQRAITLSRSPSRLTQPE